MLASLPSPGAPPLRSSQPVLWFGEWRLLDAYETGMQVLIAGFGTVVDPEKSGAAAAL